MGRCCVVSLSWLLKREDTWIHPRGAAQGELMIFVFPGLWQRSHTEPRGVGCVRAVPMNVLLWVNVQCE